jgi:hypothetical protein
MLGSPVSATTSGSGRWYAGGHDHDMFDADDGFDDDS